MQGQRREGPTSARTIRVHRTPPFVRGACERLHTRHQPGVTVHCRRAAGTPMPVRKVTSLVRALALHGVAMLRSHLASPLRPGRGVLIRSVSRRLGSAAYVREDASPNEVSSLINQRMPAALPECQTGPALPPGAQPWRDHSQHGPVRYLLKHAPRPGRYRRTRPAPRHRRLREQYGLMISCCQASNQLCISPCPTTCPVTEEPQCQIGRAHV